MEVDDGVVHHPREDGGGVGLLHYTYEHVFAVVAVQRELKVDEVPRVWAPVVHHGSIDLVDDHLVDVHGSQHDGLCARPQVYAADADVAVAVA